MSDATVTRRGGLATRSVIIGLLGAMGIAMFYVLVVAFASGSWQHLVDQMQADWILIVLVVLAFGIEVALFSELRRRHRLQAATATASGAGAGASAAGMIACCAHHLADLLPFLGAGGVATFLYDYKVPFVLVGVGITTAGIILAAHRLRHTPVVQPTESATRDGRDDFAATAVA
jgi:hypothetical protein